MKAVGAVRLGGPDVLQVVDVPMPEIGRDEILIRVLAAAVNPTDALIRSGAPLVHARQPDDAPWVPGMDLAGVVERLGEDVGSRLSVGQHVVAIIAPHGVRGAYAQYVAAPAASVVAAPLATDPVAASTLLMNAMTARRALDVLELSPADTLLVTGAAGTLGGYVLELAKLDGLKVVADAGESDVELVRSLGADEVLSRGPGLIGKLRTIHPRGVAGVVDGAVLNESVIPALAPDGRLATVRDWSGPDDRRVDVRKVRVREHLSDTDGLAGLVRLVEEGALSLRVARVFPANEAASAHRVMEAGGVRGRLVLDMSALATL